MYIIVKSNFTHIAGSICCIRLFLRHGAQKSQGILYQTVYLRQKEGLTEENLGCHECSYSSTFLFMRTFITEVYSAEHQKK